MKKFLAAALLFFSQLASANNSPIIWGPGCAFNLITGACIASGSGITSLNTLTGTSQTFSTGTSGTDFGIVSSGTVHTFNLPTSSASNRGLLAAADWSVFNAKQSALSFSSPLLNTAGTISIPVATSGANGYLSSTDWSTFNSKEPAITSGTTAQYWRGDKSFQTLNTAAVAESTNLYYTDTRVQTAAKNGTSALELYVSEDAGNDANDGSILHQYKSIGAAVTAANAIAAYYKQVNIHISPINNGGSGNGGYHENISLTQQGVNLICDDAGFFSRACVVTGTLTVNLTGTSGGANFIAASNEVKTKGLTFTSGATDTVVFTGSVYQRLIAESCYFQAGAARAANLSNTGVSGTSASQFRSYDTVFENNSSSIETVKMTAGQFWMYGTTPTVMNDNASGPSFVQAISASTTGNLTSGSACIASPGSLTGIAVGQKITDSTTAANVTGGTTVLAIPGTCTAGQIQMSANANGTATGDTLNFGGSSMIGNLTQFTGQYQQSDNTSTATFNLATIASGTASCISTPTSINLNGSLAPVGYSLLSYFGCNSTNTNSITGSGIVVMSPGNVRFGTSGDIVSTVTQAAIGPGLPQGEVMIGAGATTGTNVQLSIFGGHVKVSQTTAPTASPSANAGTSATCTLTNGRDSSGIINLTEGSGSWASGTQCTVTFNKAYGVAPNCVISPHNAAAASHQVTQQINSTTTTTTLLLVFGVADSAATASQWSYKCEEP